MVNIWKFKWNGACCYPACHTLIGFMAQKCGGTCNARAKRVLGRELGLVRYSELHLHQSNSKKIIFQKFEMKASSWPANHTHQHSKSHVKGCWAKLSSPFTLWKLVEHLFWANTSKQHLFHHFLQDQVSFRVSLFTKLCYAYDRVCCAGHFETWIIENGWLLWKLWWFKVCCSNMFLLDSWCWAWFIENGFWNVDVCCLLVMMMLPIRISGKIIFSNLIDEDEAYCSVRTLVPCPEHVSPLHCMFLQISGPYHQSACDTQAVQCTPFHLSSQELPICHFRFK